VRTDAAVELLSSKRLDKLDGRKVRTGAAVELLSSKRLVNLTKVFRILLLSSQGIENLIPRLGHNYVLPSNSFQFISDNDGVVK
jgi:hypothetical protein